QFLLRKHPTVDYRLAVAAAYLGSTSTWHAGLSGSVPLLMATPKNFMEAETGLVPISLTTFSAFNLTLTVIVVSVMVMMVRLIYPKVPIAHAPLAGVVDEAHADGGPDRAALLWVERSYAVNLVIG